MRTIEWTNRFKRDYKRESGGRHRTYLDAILAPMVEALAKDWPLARIRHQGWRERGILGAGWAEVVDSAFHVS